MSRRTVKGVERPFTHSTYTFALEWIQEVAAHLTVVPRRSRRVVHAPHVIGRALEGNKAKSDDMDFTKNVVKVWFKLYV